MGGDDFNKDNNAPATVNDDTFLGIRKAINQRLDVHQETLDAMVKDLSESMQITERIIEAVDNGKTHINISFPKHMAISRKIIGTYSYGDVADRLTKLLRLEGLKVSWYATHENKNGDLRGLSITFQR